MIDKNKIMQKIANKSLVKATHDMDKYELIEFTDEHGHEQVYLVAKGTPKPHTMYCQECDDDPEIETNRVTNK